VAFLLGTWGNAELAAVAAIVDDGVERGPAYVARSVRR
jgi:hypothetical protein